MERMKEIVGLVVERWFPNRNTQFNNELRDMVFDFHTGDLRDWIQCAQHPEALLADLKVIASIPSPEDLSSRLRNMWECHFKETLDALKTPVFFFLLFGDGAEEVFVCPFRIAYDFFHPGGLSQVEESIRHRLLKIVRDTPPEHCYWESEDEFLSMLPVGDVSPDPDELAAWFADNIQPLLAQSAVST